MGGVAVALGQTTASASIPVVLASDQTINLGATDNAVLDDIASDTEAIKTAVQIIDDLVKTEDDAHSSGDKGIMPLAVRRDTASALAGTDGDYIPFSTDANGKIWTRAAAAQDGAWTIDLGATDNAVLDAIAASVAAADTDLTTIIGHVDGIEALLTTIDADTSTLSVVGGGTEATALRVTIASDSTGVLSVDDNGSSLTVDNAGLTELAAAINASSQVDVNIAASGATVPVSGTVTAELSATDNAVLDNIDADLTTIIGHVDGIEGLLTTIDSDTGALAALILGTQADDIANTADGLQTTAFGYMFDGTTWDRMRGDSTNGLLVNLGTNNDVTITGDALTALQNIDADATTIIGHVDGIEGLLTTIDADTGGILTAIQIMDDWDNAASDGASVSGDVAHDGIDAGEPVKIGYRAIALKATPSAVAANDRTNAYASRGGIPFTIGGAPNVLTQGLQVTDADGAQTDTAVITAAAGTAVVVTKVSVMADNANTGDVSVRIGFGTANTPAADAAQVLLFHPGIAPGSGVVEGNGSGILGIGASNEDVRITCEDPAGGSVSVIVTYYTESI